ncbi:hypothetical protein [Brevundimonas sp.]|uniref:hypothetical protein n=1 Tax=Brevundimonas sp. TaxID=1871086 RepID=UPI0035AE4A2F
MFRRSSAVFPVLCLLICAVASPAHADWRRAESPRFIIYGERSERALRDYAVKLETYDFLLRLRLGAEARPFDRKLPIYLVSERGLREVQPGVGRATAGFYAPTGEDIFAVALNERDDDILFHEYFHHLSFQIGGAESLPAWLIEGLAEYYMTAEVDADGVRIGGYNENRAYGLLELPWIPLEDLLRVRPGDLDRRRGAETYYPVAWLLTHWFLSDDTRRDQLATYSRAVASGRDSVEAMREATGLSISELTRTLRSYLRGRLTVTVYTFEIPDPEITVTTLSDVEGDLLLLAQRAKMGVAGDEAQARSIAEIRRRAGRHADHPFALKLLGHAEAHSGDRGRGEQLLARYLEANPADVEALQWLAASILTRAADAETGEQRLAMTREARALLARAYEADDENYYTLFLLADSRQGAANYPTENDVETWRQAVLLAPQLPSSRLGLAAALMQSDRGEEAIALLEPLSNAPHGGATAEAAKALIDRARTGQQPLDDAALDAAAQADVETPPVPDAEPDDADGTAAPDEEN